MATGEHKPRYSQLSPAALVIAIVSLPVALLPFGIPVAVLAVLLGFAARRQAVLNARPVKIANSAIVLGFIALLAWAALILGFSLFARAS